MPVPDAGVPRQSHDHAVQLPATPDRMSTPGPDDAVQDAPRDEKVSDPLVVDWDGPDDPANPRNWSSGLQNANVVLVSTFVLYSNLAATMFAPGAGALIEEFQVTNSVLATLTVTIYVFGFSLGPLLLAPLSELYGRLPLYHISNVFYVAFTIGCALSNDIGMFLTFRFICGCAASVPMTVGGGTVADLVPENKRGRAMALYGMGPLLGPVIGPIVGGFVTQSIGWRWTFWLITILAAVFSLLAIPVLRETNEDVLLERKAARLRKVTGKPFAARTSRNLTPKQLLVRAIIRPTKMLIFSPIVLLLSLYSAFVFGLIFLLFTTFPTVFEETYGFGPGVAGLAYLGLGLGMICGLILFAILSDKLMHQPRGGTVSRPELRLPLMMWFSPITPIGFFWYGWAANNHNHWIVPIMGSYFIGLGSFFIVMPAQTYFVDIFGQQGAASALAANIVVRNIFGTFLALAAPPLYGNLGLGWGNSLLGFICLGFAPIPILFYKYGEYLRKRFVVEL